MKISQKLRNFNLFRFLRFFVDFTLFFLFLRERHILRHETVLKRIIRAETGVHS